MPGPADERVFGEVLVNGFERASAIARGVLHLLADLPQRKALPRHRRGRERPVSMTRHRADRGRVSRDIRGLMARIALEGRHAVTRLRGLHHRNMRMQVLALRGHSLARMTVQATWMLQNAPGFDEQGGGTFLPLSNARECRDGF